MKSGELYKKLLKAGWYEVWQSGTHKILMAPKHHCFPYHGSKEVGRGIENAILKQAGLK